MREFRRMAMILAECDICGSQHRVKESLVGQSIRCKDCGASMIVPPGQVISAEAFIEEGGRLRRREPVRPQSIGPAIAAGFAAFVALVALVGIVWILCLL